jgi:hypothetical protein
MGLVGGILCYCIPAQFRSASLYPEFRLQFPGTLRERLVLHGVETELGGLSPHAHIFSQQPQHAILFFRRQQLRSKIRRTDGTGFVHDHLAALIESGQRHCQRKTQQRAQQQPQCIARVDDLRVDGRFCRSPPFEATTGSPLRPPGALQRTETA